jgi:hypothetical protein
LANCHDKLIAAVNQMNVKLWNLEMNDSLLSQMMISQRTAIDPTSIYGSKSWSLSLLATLQSAAANCQVTHSEQ